ncbi:MAG: hypothetical protein KDK70_41060, partial [Myxococcales bacterium]|nr:hypothetical protein [Myxococcales bacterium]
TTPKPRASGTSARAEAPPEPASPSQPVLTTEVFAPTVHELLRAKCGGCHGVSGLAGHGAFVLTGDVAADYATTVALIDRQAPAASRLLSKASGQQHGGGPTLRAGSHEYETIFAWIEDGALASNAAAPGQASEASEAGETGEAGEAGAMPGIDATTGASPPPQSGARLGDGTPLGSAPSPLPLRLPLGLRLNGKLDFSYERRSFKGHPFGPGTNAFQTYHHFLFLSRAGADDPFGFNVELITQAFYSFNARVAPAGGALAASAV